MSWNWTTLHKHFLDLFSCNSTSHCVLFFTYSLYCLFSNLNKWLQWDHNNHGCENIIKYNRDCNISSYIFDILSTCRTKYFDMVDNFTGKGLLFMIYFSLHRTLSSTQRLSRIIVMCMWNSLKMSVFFLLMKNICFTVPLYTWNS